MGPALWQTVTEIVAKPSRAYTQRREPKQNFQYLLYLTKVNDKNSHKAQSIGSLEKCCPEQGKTFVPFDAQQTLHPACTQRPHNLYAQQAYNPCAQPIPRCAHKCAQPCAHNICAQLHDIRAHHQPLCSQGFFLLNTVCEKLMDLQGFCRFT